MITRSALKAEIDKLHEDDLDLAYSILQSILRQYDRTPQQSFMEKLHSICIDEPADFSRNIERYLKQRGTDAAMLTELTHSQEKHDDSR